MHRKVVIGCDEVGYGSWAGAIVVAAVVYPVFGGSVFSERKPVPGLRDSKKISENERNRLDPIIKDSALYWVILGSGSKAIDRVGVDKCRMTCMEWCIFFCRYYFPNSHVIVDGNRPIPRVKDQTCIVKADDKIPSVQAASIIAKVYRDKMMIKLAEKYPRYGFEKHKGYGTPYHTKTLLKYGPCLQHRRSYKPIKEVLRARCKDDKTEL